jgi:hypothetical protein
VAGGCAIFQAGGLIVVVVEVTRKAYLASLVPVIVDAILNEHQVVVDIVNFVSHGDFPRSRLGEKQRGKVLASWVTRKLRTIAQFSIRDLDGADGPFADLPQHRVSRGSKPGSTMGSSLRKSTLVNPESEVPRSPAPVVLEDSIQQAQTSPYQDMPSPGLPQEPGAPSSFAGTPVPEPSPGLPHIDEPQSATLVTEDVDDHNVGYTNPVSGTETAHNRDFRFSFDMDDTPIDPQQYESAVPNAESPSPGRDALPSQKQFSTVPAGAEPVQEGKAGPSTQESGNIDDWPQEALIYQSTLGVDGGSDFVQRSPSNMSDAVRKRYDGSEYGP